MPRIEVSQDTMDRIDQLVQDLRAEGRMGDSRADVVGALARWTSAPALAGMLTAYIIERFNAGE